MITTHMNPIVLRTYATKLVRCPCSDKRETYVFNNESKHWQCKNCSCSLELTSSETKKYTFKSNTVVLMNYLLDMGYPVVDVTLEVKDEPDYVVAGKVVLVDTNPTEDPKKPRRLLELVVWTDGKTVSYKVYAIKYTTKGRRTGMTSFYCDNLMKLAIDLETQHNIADLVVNVLGLRLPGALFDTEEIERRLAVESAEQELYDAKEELARYRKEARKTK